MKKVSNLSLNGKASISRCGHYRYTLERELHRKRTKTLAFIGINPSVANATINDATVRKLIAFAKRERASHFVIVNVFAYRSADVKALALAEHPVGKHNTRYIKAAFDQADAIVPCWGSRTKIAKKWHKHLERMNIRLKRQTKPVYCFGKTQSGDPLHPLMLKANTPLQPWSIC